MRRARPTASGLGVVGLSVLIAVAAGCGQATTPSARDGGVLAAPAATASDAPSTAAADQRGAIDQCRAGDDRGSGHERRHRAARPQPSRAATQLVPSRTRREIRRRPCPNRPRSTQLASSSTSRTSRSTRADRSSSRSIVDSAAAHLVVQQGATGLEIASLDVKPGWRRGRAGRVADRDHAALRARLLGGRHQDLGQWSRDLELGERVERPVTPGAEPL